MIYVKDLNYSYGKEPIFEGADFFVEKNSRVGLVGPNGSGKSTLFKIITGEYEADSGKVEVGNKVLMVPQEIKYDPIMEAAGTIRQYVDPLRIKEDYEILRILSKMELGQFGLDSPPLNLSGGQKTKLAITRALVAEPEILLLDEPTNFLDVEGKKWVMNFLGKYPKTLMVISHDLELLDKNINKILEINIQSHKIEEYSGNYSNYVKLKSEKEALLIRQRKVTEKHIIRMKKGLLKMSHVKSEKGVRQKLQLEKRIETMEEKLPAMPAEARRIKVGLPEPSWVGEMPIIAKKINKSYGNKRVLTDVVFDIRRGERIAIMGENGAGKSTLIKILAGKVTADSGEIIRDEKLKIGYYSQEFEGLDFEKTLLESIKEKCQLPEGVLRSQLGRFLFSGEKVFQRVKSLSGGEKTRLSIALLLVQSFNLLILDEPTTYLDVLSQRLILEAVKAYKGALIVVSHTKEFIEELKPDRKLYLPDNRWEICRI